MTEFQELERRYSTGDLIQDDTIRVLLVDMDRRVMLGKMVKKPWIEYAIWNIDRNGGLYRGGYYMTFNRDEEPELMLNVIKNYVKRLNEEKV